MQVKSIKGHFINDLEKELSSVLFNDFVADLAIVFCSVSQNIHEVRQLFTKNNIDLIGATTAGEIFNNSVYEKSIVALLIKFDRVDSYTIDLYENEYAGLKDLGEAAAKDIKRKFDDPAIIVLSGGIRADGEELVRGFTDNLIDHNNLFGALAGDDLKMQETYIFTGDQTSNNGIVCLSLDSSYIRAKGVATSGWESIGTEKLITKSRGNVVFSIDNQPAIDIFLDYFNKSKEYLESNNTVIRELAQYPLQVMRGGNYSVLRAPLLADKEKGALIFSGTVKEGSRIKFSVPPGFETIESTAKEISKIKNKIPEADAILIFSCKARHQALGPLVEEEIEGIQNLWNVPLIGFFSYGEIGNIGDHQCDFHNETVSLVALKEL